MTANFQDYGNARQEVLCLLFMRYQIGFAVGTQLAELWLRQNSQESWETLKDYLLHGQILFQQDTLLDLRQLPREVLSQLADSLRGEGGVQIKDRWYNFRKYPRCFIGQELVHWLQTHHHAPLPEALRIGQLLLENRFIHHVKDEHDFKNEFLFYRFYVDEMP